MAKKNIKELLNKFKEDDVDHIEDKGRFPLKPVKLIDCEICKNFEVWGGEKQYCVAYDCYPFKHKIPVEEYCNEFTLDKIKEKIYNAKVKKLHW